MGPYGLMYRALDVNKSKNNIPGRSPIKIIEKDRLRLLISLYSDFLRRNSYPQQEIISYLLKATYVLRMKIRNLRSEVLARQMASNNVNEEVNIRRRLRYDWRE
ncbi:hypothetical protein TSAR_005510 [Trichomalopsis sarcophagae]|uniref:Uncharacterized protein n=1 Tax=Trichomalopsis sarcophagae TaxID=543379 RepID=A0A232EF95_9HYME|nr:hypothetical protein TSAR_005510 [Trichomalopsis sarcophagae]